jgi:micrococcal nuclease
MPHELWSANAKPSFLEMVDSWPLFAALASPPDQGVTSPADFEYVQRVIDGDTLMLGTGDRVRLIGVDTPETKHPNKPVEYFSKEA